MNSFQALQSLISQSKPQQQQRLPVQQAVPVRPSLPVVTSPTQTSPLQVRQPTAPVANNPQKASVLGRGLASSPVNSDAQQGAAQLQATQRTRIAQPQQPFNQQQRNQPSVAAQSLSRLANNKLDTMPHIVNANNPANRFATPAAYMHYLDTASPAQIKQDLYGSPNTAVDTNAVNRKQTLPPVRGRYR